MTHVGQKQKTPVALFVYNRPQHANLALESLSRCERLAECALFIFCDGPKRDEDGQSVRQARQVARTWAEQLGGRVIERETNLGLSRSIVTGVSELCEQYGRVIVLEDDFVVSPLFVDYMLQALDLYADEPNVYQISGYMFPVEHAASADAFFLPLTTTWGWATWERAWRKFDWDASDALQKLKDPQVRRAFDLDGSYRYAEMLEQRLRNENDSWGLLWYWAVFKAGGLVLHPRQSLIWVGGFDKSGTHCGEYLWSNQNAPERITAMDHASTFRFPEVRGSNAAALRRIIKFLRAERNSTTLLGRLYRRYVRGSETARV